MSTETVEASEVSESAETESIQINDARTKHSSVRRKHRPGLQRVSIACERCRSRKNKCDRKLPECSTCKAAGAVCVVQDRLTNRQYPRGHVEGLEAEVQRLNARIEELELETSVLRQELGKRPVELVGDMPTSSHHTPATDPNAPVHSASTFANISEELNIVPRNVTDGQRYVGDSSGLFFGTIVQNVLLHADYKGEQGPLSSSFRLRVGERQENSSVSPLNVFPQPSQLSLPDVDLAHQLEQAYFTHRWPSLPFIHRPTFVESHLRPVLASPQHATHVSLFLTLMVFALGAIDMRRQNPDFGHKHLEYFKLATDNYLQGLLREDSIETVQGLILVGQFSINENKSANAWLVCGQAVRSAIDLGLHRDQPASIASGERNMLDIELRKRIFWSAYAIDRNVSITLGRPCAIRDEDIDVPFPQNLRDEDLVGEYTLVESPRTALFQSLDMSAFIHIIKLRRTQSRIQGLFYAAENCRALPGGVAMYRANIRTQLDEWIALTPRYLQPTKATFQSTEWFQIAYSHALLLLYRPSPADPTIDSNALQICADSAISLISSYSSLYAKNKITYTWIALHSLFMASITMLYTLYTSPEIRSSTTKTVVKSNIVSCLALFEVMAEYWPLSARCHDIIERLGSVTIELFDTPTERRPNTRPHSIPVEQPMQQHFGQIDAEFREWFGARVKTSGVNTNTGEGFVVSVHDGRTMQDPTEHCPDDMDLFSGSLDDFFPAFDTAIPMMMNAFGNDPNGLLHTPRQPDTSDQTMNTLSSM